MNGAQITYTYIPHHPTYLKKWMPEDSTTITWSWIKKALPSMEAASNVVWLLNTLARPSLCTLHKLPLPNKKMKEAHEELMKGLKTLSKEISRRDHEYNFLDPKLVPCSISV